MKEMIYAIYWEKKPGKVRKDGTTYVVSENITEALAMFTTTHPDREVCSIYKEGDELLMTNRYKVE